MDRGMTLTLAVRSGEERVDTNGARIQAHGGSILYLDGVFYWYGENKEHTVPRSGIWHWGVRCYTSTDLHTWDDQGLVIPLSSTTRVPRIIRRNYWTGHTSSASLIPVGLFVGCESRPGRVGRNPCWCSPPTRSSVRTRLCGPDYGHSEWTRVILILSSTRRMGRAIATLSEFIGS